MEQDATLAFDDHYSQGAPKLPRIDDRWTGTLRNFPVGTLEEGFSNPTTVCIVDPRLFAKNSLKFTSDLRRLNQAFPLSKSVDRALSASGGARMAIEGLLIQLSYAVWQIRTGEVSCSTVNDLEENFRKYTIRCYLAKNVTMQHREHPVHEPYIRKYYGFLERYYLRMYHQELQEQFLAKYPRMNEVWDNWERALWCPATVPQCQPTTSGGRVLVLEQPQPVVCRYSSAPRAGRSRSRSRSRGRD